MNGSCKEVFLVNKTVEDYIKDVMVCVRNCQKLSGELSGWHHYRDYSGVERTIAQVNGSLMSLISNIFKHQDIKIGLTRHKLLDQFDMVREGNDALFERINSDIDEASGLRKNADAEILDPSGLKKVEGPSIVTGKNVVLLASRSVQKPQIFFEKKIDNSHKRPFLPLIEEKPNNIKPLSIMLCIDDTGKEYYSHPYEYELQHWNPASSQLEPVTPQLPNPVADTPIIMVETVEDLARMVSELKECKEFGFDIEHHSYRSYQGLACLMQISTREMDYIVDPLALRGKLTILNEVFTDPKITKVAHGADHDIFWLQRDFGVYIVNLFDTHQAAVVLEYPHRSLAALLSRFCSIEANKVYQRADWRIRPLPEDFTNYARQDSHHLLYIFDMMRNELIQKGNNLNNLITAVYSRSAEICTKRYEKPIIGPDSHMEIYRRSRKTFNSRQMFALQALYLWRDRVAREQDESPEYVLPKHMLLQICEVLPKEMQGILACCNPIPPLVKTELLTMHTLIREARQQTLIDIKPSILETQLASCPTTDDLGSELINRHDLSQCEENPVGLPVLINPGDNLLGDLFEEHKIKVALKELSQMFGCYKTNLDHKLKGHYELSKQFISPFERYTTYLEMKPFIEGEKKKGADQDRIQRIMDHFLTLTENTEKDLEAEKDDEVRAFRQENENSEAPAPLNLPEVSFASMKREPQEALISNERQITHQAIDSFLESARMSANPCQDTESNDDAERVGQLLLHFRSLSGKPSPKLKPSSPPSDEEMVDGSSNVAEETEKNPVKKKKKDVKKVILGDEMKMKKPKNKATKRSSTGTTDETPPKKVKVEEEGDVDGENEEGELSDSRSEENDEPAGFDYASADYSIFQKARLKASHKRPFKDKFQGKRGKRRGKM